MEIGLAVCILAMPGRCVYPSLLTPLPSPLDLFQSSDMVSMTSLSAPSSHLHPAIQSGRHAAVQVAPAPQPLQAPASAPPQAAAPAAAAAPPPPAPVAVHAPSTAASLSATPSAETPTTPKPSAPSAPAVAHMPQPAPAQVLPSPWLLYSKQHIVFGRKNQSCNKTTKLQKYWGLVYGPSYIAQLCQM